MAGSDVAERYRLEEEIGRGGMGSVWRALDLRLKRRVALKRMNAEHLTRPSARARFQQEAVAIAQLQDPHVVQIYDYGIDGDMPYFVMELLDGEDLNARLQRHGQLPPPFVLKLVDQIARALDAAHAAGMVHRDLKPDNVFLARSVNGAETVKILDFGIAALAASLAEEAASTRPIILGTPPYMSPEQARGSQLVDHRSDLWSLAVLAYRGLTGKLPFPAEGAGDVLVAVCVDAPRPPSLEEPTLPPALDGFFERAFAKDPAQRFQSGRELGAALSRAMDSGSSTLHILVVDDEPHAVYLLTQSFRKEIAASRYRFVFAADGNEALAALREHPEMDVALTDIRMPGMDGLTFLTRARELRPDLPVLVLSAYGDMANLREAMNRGAFDFLIKPIEMSDVAATIDKAVEHARRLRAAASSVAQNRALRMFVSSRVADRLQAPLVGIEALPDEIGEATLALLHVCGFEGPVDAASAAPTLRRLNASFEIMIPEVVARGGTVHKLCGSVLVAVFTGPDHVAQALAACISVRDQLAWVSANAADPPCPDGVRIAIATGTLLRGCAGSRSYMRLDDMLLGAPTTAARALLDQALPGEILVSDAVHIEAERAFDLLPRAASPGAGGSALSWSVVRKMPPVRFPGAETMRVDPGEP